MLLFVLIILVKLISANDLNVQEIIVSNNYFSSSLYKKVYPTTTKNFILSPFLSHLALCLLKSGSTGQTSEEIRSLLQLSDERSIQSGYKTLLPELTGNGFALLHTTSKIYTSSNYPLKSNYRKIIQEVYKAQSQNVDFGQKTKTLQEMNEWIEQNTKNQIKNIVSQNSVSVNSRLILLDVLYFRSNWTNNFSVRKNTFHRNQYESIQVDTLYTTDKFKFFESLEIGAKFLELSLHSDISLIFVLPYAINGLDELEKQIGRIIQPHSFTEEKMLFAIPRFKLESKVHLKNILKSMGVDRIFNPNKANLDQMSENSYGLYVDNIFQKISLEVNRYGAEGGTGSGSGLKVNTFIVTQSGPQSFILDRPFLFYFKIHGIVGFIGRVVDPSL